MRKLKLQVQMTVNGFIAGPNGEMDFMVWNWDDKLNQYVDKLTQPVDCIVLGRKLAEGFIPYWANVALDSKNPEFTAGKKFTETHKVVFTKTLKKSNWENTIVANGELVDEINNLKKQNGKDIIVYGGANFVSALIEKDLIDEYHLFINPSAIPGGMTIFSKLESNRNMKLVKSESFECGIVVLHYKQIKSQ